MTNWQNGYDHLFEAERNEPHDFEHFRTNKKYGFAVPYGNQADEPDYEALGKALALYPAYAGILMYDKPDLGYGNGLKYCKCDVIDSRHIMMLCHLHSFREIFWNKIVIEIGGGWGNWAYLTRAINWTIVDLPWMLELQKWFIKESGLIRGNIKYVSNDDSSDFANKLDSVELLIGSHSLSEFNWETFEQYAIDYFPKTKYFYYATHLTKPSPSLVTKKLDYIEQYFERVDTLLSEKDTVVNILYKYKL